ncbi:conserved hypothetical protein [Trichinella spiralis]|uniref:hypothetical protein n=1 Tax=Trichinella spiralis TaxID=6334 RepID=UPI0001EFDA53|nr:conserved hypothetical protein [Trichinella spiralis]XP_003370995.1 conserved hypothetical protein [Trichinella spiralis]
MMLSSDSSIDPCRLTVAKLLIKIVKHSFSQTQAEASAKQQQQQQNKINVCILMMIVVVQIKQHFSIDFNLSTQFAVDYADDEELSKTVSQSMHFPFPAEAMQEAMHSVK